jgi:sulfite exporter TauE/SafE/copper chaperone CopZ
VQTVKTHFDVGGMTCANCRTKIENALRGTAGVVSARVSYTAGTADAEFDDSAVSRGELAAVIEHLGYRVLDGDAKPSGGASRAVGFALIIAALFMVLRHTGVLNLLVPGRLADSQTSLAMLLVIGLLTSAHCAAMCGGLSISHIASHSGDGRLAALRPAALYNLGRVASYTAIGFIVGALGAVISLSAAFQGALKLAAGAFMVIAGVNILGVFPGLRRFAPRIPKVFARGINAEKARTNSPLIVGLLNGLMPCGPLQAMQLYALSTGSALRGAVAMLLFSLGTVPLMFSLGALASLLKRRFARKIATAGAVLVVVLGLSMLSQGFALANINIGVLSPGSQSAVTDRAMLTGEVQVVRSTLASGSYPTITVEPGTPVRWIIDAPDGSINGCNNRMLLRAYGVEHTFTVGENVIEFTPETSGTVRYTCWMGMIGGKIIVN